ncbi:FeoB-associated Cys-rich membrane protein [Tenacibaculum sp. Mcav3-52]|uniref:FeoB-associated Cys-rich membrane protein n=1 Tax=Tenacibaculum mesophilum TaxID=104268 RepID=A0AAE9MPH1_9FLAO|nr:MULTISPECIES: FeoB-associated Cys-rich membrane protein [Tenacibaculum]AZJ33120.1 FeoB-associated Cys-rich membrane protein [Tenacibaculum mesophilum]MCG7500655.1 FeoB-associated Cys-rich membrane protein [Tenacibaculum sp. Mcav3-52]MCO7184314.1 FeoB-associated Cys-rich membrane protein [Tenacibaculum sp. XPcli2-G]QFS28370.1 FeoB-associated Cys-rich membrane protein [Tenacibaculum mesophilum]UTD15828.1 FeoB-associated Cys-rich membrane protein [Tenacibaculum mesophilum]
MQEVLTYLVVCGAVIFLVKKFFFKPKKNSSCDTNCNCS